MSNGQAKNGAAKQKPALDLRSRIAQWREQLLDLTKRNRLISCRLSNRGLVQLEYPSPQQLWDGIVVQNQTFTFPWKRELLGLDEAEVEQLLSEEAEAGSPSLTARTPVSRPHEFEDCLKSPELSETDMLTKLSDKDLGRRLYRLALNAATSLSEQGVNTLYLASGFLRYYESEDSDIAMTAPLLLVPVTLTRLTTHAAWQLCEYEDEVVLNHSLAQLLESDFRVKLPEITDEQFQDDPKARDVYLDRVREAISANPRWQVEDHVALSVFSFQKLAMWKDMGENEGNVSKHPLCAAIGGESGGTVNDGLRPLPAAREYDRAVLPKDTFHILAADSSQQEAILAAKAGYSFVLDGPPGTGKSQTIANIIAEFLAAGRKVLFVSEKAAALEVVKRRLDACQLGDFCLECHSHKANKREVITELGRCLQLASETYEDQSRRLGELQAIREKLNGYVIDLHAPKLPLGFTPFQVHGLLARISTVSVTRCTIVDVLEISAERLAVLARGVARLRDHENAIKEYQTHPWRSVRVASHSLSLGDDIRHQFAVLADELERATQRFVGLSELGFCSLRPSRSEMTQALDAVCTAIKFPQAPASWFGDGPPEQLVQGERVAAAKQMAAGFVELNRLTQAFRQEAGILQQYRPEALLESHETLASDFAGQHEFLPRLGGPQADTVRQSLDWVCGQAIPLVQTLRDDLEAINRCVATIVTLLGVPILTDITVKRLPKLSRLAAVISRLSAVRPNWFDANTRAELNHLANGCALEQQQTASLRAGLADRLSPRAFDEGAEPLAERSLIYRSFLARVFKGWRAYRTEALDLYMAQPELKTRAILADLWRLRQFHRHRATLRKLALQHQEAVPCQPNGDADWQDIHAQLELIEELTQVGELPAALKESLCSPGVIDRKALGEQAELLEQLSARMEPHIDKLQECCTATNVPHLLCSSSGARLEEATTAVSALLVRLQGSDACLQRIQSLLNDQANPAMNRVLGDLNTLQRLRMWQIQAHALAAQLGVETGERPVEDRDWSEEARTGQWLLDFMNGHRDAPPLPLLRMSVDPSFREKGIAAAEAAKQAFTPALDTNWAFLAGMFDEQQEVAPQLLPLQSPAVELASWLRLRCADLHLLREWLALRELLAHLKELGLWRLAEEVLQKDLPLPDAENSFMARFYRLWLDAVYLERPALCGFEVQQHEALIGKFRELDRNCVAGNFKRIRTVLLADSVRAFGFDGPDVGELGILRREANKQRRHLPLRQLFKKIPQWLLRLKPCMMMSPLSVSTYLDSAEITFDAVIFDEASQVRPHDAICAIYRGKQLIVAGDPKQLPPTAFFDHMGEDDVIEAADNEELQESISDFESILDICSSLQLPRKRLKWHFRSKRESLIAFSNSHFYGNELVTFPSVHDLSHASAVAFEFVKEGVWQSGSSGGFNRPEARRTAELVFEHFRQHPSESLGVITMNVRQQFAVLEEIERLRREQPEFETFFDDSRHERFFVKNLENVQGDERDRIIISIGYGPDASGKISMRFGPLNNLGGERRLNVAVTRSRTGMVLVSSIKAHDIDLTRSGSVGARLLRSYLDYAERGIEALAAEITEAGQREVESPFEAEVAQALESQGLAVHKQVGCSGFRIDLAIVHPQRPGQYVLGIECDGATYHSSATARDRDRLRQEILESLGWRIFRIWSTDWIRHRQSQISRLLDEYSRAMQAPEAVRAEANPLPAPVQEQPRIQPPRINGRHEYSDIAEVPRERLEATILELLRACGKTSEEELLVEVARMLGFQRLGSRIRGAAKTAVTRLIRGNAICRLADNHLQMLQ